MGKMTRPSFFSVARHIFIRDGLAGFSRGLGPCFLRAFPTNASALFVYEGTMRLLGAEKVQLYILIKPRGAALLTLSLHRPGAEY